MVNTDCLIHSTRRTYQDRMEDGNGDRHKKAMMVRKKGEKLLGAAGSERRTSEF